jgi:hypothetical protein
MLAAFQVLLYNKLQLSNIISAHAAYFSIFESIKHRLGADQHVLSSY